MEYKFRGKCTKTNQWVYGDLLQRKDSFGKLYLIDMQDSEPPFEINTHHAYAESVGMCSTIWDKNLIDIYEGDVIKVAGRLLKVVFDAGCFLSIWGNNRYRLNRWGSEGVEIIGNIYDNPELLNPASGITGVNHMLQDPKDGQEAAGAAVAAEAANEQATEIEQVPGEEKGSEEEG